MKPRYRRMLDLLKRDKERLAREACEWSVYVVRCGDDSLYTGIAKDVEARVDAHNAGRGAAYTRPRRPVRLLYREPGLTRTEALVREARIKSLTRAEKQSLISGASPRRP